MDGLWPTVPYGPANNFKMVMKQQLLLSHQTVGSFTKTERCGNAIGGVKDTGS
jgi:hypothetical protein